MAKIVVAPKKGLSDPEGETVRDRLRRKKFSKLRRVRSGKYWEVEFEAASRDEAISYIAGVYTAPPLVNPVKDAAMLVGLEEMG